MFKRISAKNLFSWETLDYEVSSGISQITGFNFDDGTSEGSGKSSIPNVLCWVLYGSIPKSARVDDVIRQGCTSGSGEVEFTSGLCVSRSRRPNGLSIRTPDGQTVRGKDAKETQQLINKAVGLDFNAFCQAVYFAQDYPNKFISSSETDKAAILSEIQDLSKLDRARKKVSDDLKRALEIKLETERQLAKIEADAQRVTSNIDLLESFIKRFKTDKASRIANLELAQAEVTQRLASLERFTNYSEKDVELELATLDQALASLEAKRLECKVSLTAADAINRDRKRLLSIIREAGISADRASNRLIHLTGRDSEPGACPTCGQQASEEMLKAHRKHVEEEQASLLEDLDQHKRVQEQSKAQLTELKDLPSLAEAEQMLKEIEDETKGLNASKKKLWQLQAEYVAAKKESIRLEEKAKSLVAELETVKEQLPTEEYRKLEALHGDLIALDANAEELLDELHHQKKEINNLEILKSGFKEMKQYIFQSLLNELSVKATSLASELFEIPVSIQFSNEDDEGGVSKIKTVVVLDGNERSLGLLSGGQLARTTLAVDLALAGIVAQRSENPLNFRILDEPFKNLSESSMAKVVELLSKLKGSTIVIEHNSLIKSIIHRTFNVEYRNGVSHAA